MQRWVSTILTLSCTRQIKLALAKDPTNSEYLNLKEELTSLIELTKEYLESTQTDTAPAASTSGTTKSSSAASTSTQRPPSSSSSKQTTPSTFIPTHSLKAGDDCQARFSGDAKFYPARITSVGGADTNRVYSIVFKGYDSTELVSHNDIKPLTDNKKRMIEVEEEEKEKERKRKKNEKKADTKEVKNKEQGDRQKTWQSFTKKSAKKGIGEINQTIPPLFERVLTYSSVWLVVVIPGVTGRPCPSLPRLIFLLTLFCP